MLHKIRLIPGLDKQSSDTGAEGKWVNADYTRFRYGFPEKVGGWEQLVDNNLIGAGRDQHTWVDLAGISMRLLEPISAFTFILKERSTISLL